MQKPRGISYAAITAVLALLLIVTLVQGFGSRNNSSAPDTSVLPSVPPVPSAPPSAVASASASAAPSAAASGSPSASASAAVPASASAVPAASASAAASAKPAARKTYTAPPPMTIDTSKVYTATMETDKGTIVMQLDPKLAPVTVNNFVTLANDGFYDGLLFHRVVQDFIIQGGDPAGTGQGGPGYSFADEPVKGEYTAGCVAMANAGPNTNGSQFFICTVDDTQKLQKLYNLFGYVTQGLDVANKIQQGDHIKKVTIS